MPPLWQQGSRAVLVRLQCHHVEERLKPVTGSSPARFDTFCFGSIPIDGSTYEHDVIIDRGEIRKRKKRPAKKFREQIGHTPLSMEEISWQCSQLVSGSGAYGRLPVMQKVEREVGRHKIKLLALPTIDAVEVLKRDPNDTNAILHVTC
jgi:hypothetical protein